MVLPMHTMLALLHEYFVGGTLRIGGTWGGAKCLSHLPIATHLAESTTWILATCGCFYLLGSKQSHESFLRTTGSIALGPSALDHALAAVNLLLWVFVLYSKIKIHSLCNLFQPCHILLLINAAALHSKGSLSACLSVYSLPLVLGAWAAIGVHTFT